MIKNVIPLSLAFMAGVSTIVQQVLNTNLRTELSSAAWSGFVSYVGGIACMVLLVIAFRDPIPSVATVARVPWWAWTGGIFGAFFIGLAIVIIPKIGAATFIMLIVAGQMVASLTVDHFGWLGVAERPIDLPRFIGVGFLIAAAFLIRR